MQRTKRCYINKYRIHYIEGKRLEKELFKIDKKI